MFTLTGSYGRVTGDRKYCCLLKIISHVSANDIQVWVKHIPRNKKSKIKSRVLIVDTDKFSSDGVDGKAHLHQININTGTTRVRPAVWEQRKGGADQDTPEIKTRGFSTRRRARDGVE